MATLDTNWPQRPIYPGEAGWSNHDPFNEHFLANQQSASRPQHANTYAFQANLAGAGHESIDAPVSPSTPHYITHASTKPPPLLSPVPTWDQLRVPTWLESHDEYSQWQPNPPPNIEQHHPGAGERVVPLEHRAQREDHCREWVRTRQRRQSSKHSREVKLQEGKRQARASRIAEAKVRLRENKERWKALARKAEGCEEDLVMED